VPGDTIAAIYLLLLLLADVCSVASQDAAASTSMDAAVRLIHLNALMRQAVKLIKGVQLSIDEDRFKFGVFSAISWFKVGEGWQQPWEQGGGGWGCLMCRSECGTIATKQFSWQTSGHGAVVAAVTVVGCML
jgi:hypothetical protein